MTARFSTLASGSSGNAALLWSEQAGLLIDFGLGPRTIASRFRSIGMTWDQVNAAVLTHTHGDHWRRETLQLLLRNRVPLHCHPRHLDGMASATSELQDLRNAGLLRFFEEGRDIPLPGGMTARAFEVAHDSFPTFAFRVDAPDWSAGYAADLGTWTECHVDAFRNVDLFAVEFNHDEDMERRSPRPAHLIERVLGDRGHLSNRQAGHLVRTLIEVSESARLGHVVQLHLSRQCNRPELAADAARRALTAAGSGARVHTAEQDRVLPPVRIEPAGPRPKPIPKLVQRTLPGFGEDE